jgi:predicted transcriptional regulator
MAEGLRRLAAEIVSSYVENNVIAPGDLEALISSTLGALESAASPPSESGPVAKATAAQIGKSINPGAPISFVDGQPYLMLNDISESTG